MNSFVKKNKSLKCGFVIKLLSIIAIVCTAISSISYFFYYDYDIINGEWIYELSFHFPYFMNLISLFLSIAPFVLFVLYIFKYHNKLKATILVSIIFGVLAFEILFNFFTGSSRFYYGAIFTLIQLLVVVTCILALISALKGFNKKIYVIIAMSVCLLFEALSFVSVISIMDYYIEDSIYLYMFTSPLGIIGAISLYISLLLFATKNRIPAIISVSVKKKSAESLNHEQALRILKDKLDFGMITEEEYQAQRAEIISKL